MSVLVEALTVVIPRRVIEESYEGGLDGYASSAPNGTYRADAHLTAISFMTPDDVDWYVGELSRQGVVVMHEGHSEEVAIVDQRNGTQKGCEWLDFEAGQDGPSLCWWKGTARGEMMAYEGWAFEQSLSAPAPPEPSPRPREPLTDSTRPDRPLGTHFDLAELTEAIDAELQEVTSMVERSRATDIGCDLWYFEVDDAVGFLSCETNEEDIGVPTVTLALAVGVADDLQRDELLELLERNNHLYQASVVITPPLPMGDEVHRMIAVQRRVDARIFHPQSFLDHLKELQMNSELFLSNVFGQETLH